MPVPSTVLVIDDDEEIQEILSEALDFLGYTVIVAGTIDEAEAVRRPVGSPAIGLVICDVHLTGNLEDIGGYQLYQRWAISDVALPFVLISGDLSIKNLPAVRAGKVHFIAKPFAVDELLATVQRLLPIV